MAKTPKSQKSYWPIPLNTIETMAGCLAFQAQQRLSETITQAGCQRNEAWGELYQSWFGRFIKKYHKNSQTFFRN